MAAVHECASGHRGLVMAVNALIQSIVQFAVTLATAFGAYKTVRPAVPCQSISTVLLGGVLLCELFEGNSLDLALTFFSFSADL